jgi:hypothetical protein
MRPNPAITRLLLAALVLMLVRPALAASEIGSERIHFKKGETSAIVEGTISGYTSIDYLLRAGKGQHMNASMATDNGANYFNILAPGDDEVAIFNGSISENQYEGTLPASGDYKIRVYLMRSAARREETANYRLQIVITGNTETSPEIDHDAAATTAASRAVKGDFDATGTLPCAQHAGQPMAECNFGVARAAGGTAAVVVTKPDGNTRALFFTGGRFSSADTSQADGYPEYSARRESDLNMIRVGDERYEVPDAAIYGG